ncbi:MAG TPA: pantoate--beta-alanine ligase [Nitrospirae bacterium]|nr:pantothenate synthetase [bacterium BMS3Abin06]HDH12538.1 pantoate--beta-alanine ligase [Nitrospirota bacterium]HDZ00697.1 pantoate--beta-alanine ligase [Nitrospirota bacterium]
MQIIKTIKEMQSLSRRLRVEGKTIGFAPTMGALHEGHLSLVRRSKEENDITVVSIFVNPAQFGPNEDFQKYPRSAEDDLQKLSTLHADAVFMPDNNEMYPEGFSTSINIGAIGEILCGVSRPGHFNGVATIVARLFNTVMPDRAYFGRKDFQQTAVIKKLVRELNFDTDIIVCPTVREPDGLAMSSRNAYLNMEERKSSLILYMALKLGEELILSRGMHDASTVKKEMATLIKTEPLVDIDYIDIVNPRNLDPVQKIMLPAAICLAVKIGNTRLIDNIIVEKS